MKSNSGWMVEKCKETGETCIVQFKTWKGAETIAVVEHTAYAALISAAPELLEAARLACAFIKVTYDERDDWKNIEAFKVLTAAIAKAEGKENE